MKTSPATTLIAGLTAAGAAALMIWMLVAQPGAPHSACRTVTHVPSAPHARAVAPDRATASVRGRDDEFNQPAKSIGQISTRLKEESDGTLLEISTTVALDGTVLSTTQRKVEPAADFYACFPQGGAASSVTPDRFGMRPKRVPVLPLVFQEVAAGSVLLEPDHIAAAVAVQDQFFESLGGDTVDPGTTEYKNKWQREQPLADQRLRAAIGAHAFAAWQAEAYLRAKATAGRP